MVVIKENVHICTIHSSIGHQVNNLLSCSLEKNIVKCYTCKSVH